MVQELADITRTTEVFSADTLFGKLCVELRNQKEIILLSLLNTAKRWEITNGKFVLSMVNVVEYTTIKKDKYKAMIEKIVGMPVDIVLLDEEQTQSLEEYLKEKIKGLIID